MRVSGIHAVPADLVGVGISAPTRSLYKKFKVSSETSKKAGAALSRAQEIAAAHYNAALRAIENDHLEAALIDLRTAAEIDPIDREILSELSWVLSELGRSDEALEAVEKLIDLDPSKDWSWKIRAQALRELGRLEEAEKSFNRVIGHNPGDFEALYGQALVFQRKGEPEAALDYARRTVDADRDYLKGYALRDDILYQLGRYTDALAGFEETARRWPKDGYARSRIVELLWESGRQAEARAAVTSFLRACPDDAVAHMQSGFVLLEDGKYDDAIRVLETSIRLDNTNAHTYLNLGEALVRNGRVAEAVAAHQRAVEISPAPYIHDSFGTSLLAAHKPRAAFRQFVRAVRGDPELEGVFVRLGDTFRELGKDVWAAHAYREAVRRDGAAFYILDQLATACLYSGQFTDALEAFDKAVTIQSGDETIAKRALAEDTVKWINIISTGALIGTRSGRISVLDDDDFKRVADYLAERFPAERREKFIQNFLKAVADATESMVPEAVPAAIVAPIAKNLPPAAPELYADRSDRQENPEQFIKRVYIDVFGEPAVSGLTQTDLARLDPQLHNRYRNWKVGKTLAFEIPTRDSVLANLTAEERLARIRSQTSERRRRSEAVPGAIVEPIEKRLPDVAPELYAARPDRHEDPEQFIMRVYGDPAETGMTQPDLAHLDPQLYNRYRNWKVTHKATLRLPTRDDVIAATPAEEQLGRLRGQAKQAQARYRERLTKGKPAP